MAFRILVSLENREVSIPAKSTMVASVGPIVYIVMAITSMCPTLDARTFLCVYFRFLLLEACLTCDSD
jgi:hypothetical protein